ncbi:pinin-like [Dermacentor silvarum]|uniref:pinin-like n=1 Tax=Dermacentor silvarum TaxID=543639 RepID=UPI002100A4A0|nr:pinin-like [Dermacentor silvarum]
MAWLCDCDDGTAPMKQEPPKKQQQESKTGQQGAAGLVSVDKARMPPSEGELAPEFSGPRPGLEGQSGVASSFTSMRTQNYNATIEPGEPSSCSRKKSSIGDVIRRSEQPGQAARQASSRESRRSDKGSGKGEEKALPAENAPDKVYGKSDSKTSTSRTSSEKHKHRKSHRKHRHRESGPCCCPMYEVEVVKTAGAAALGGRQRHLQSDKLGMQVVTTETVTKRLYKYNIDVDLPEGIRVSPRGKLVEDQGVSAENGAYDNMPQQYSAEPAYQPPYGQTYPHPQRPQLTYSPQDQVVPYESQQPAGRYMQFQQQQISTNGARTGMMQVSSYEMLQHRVASPSMMPMVPRHEATQHLRGQMQLTHPRKVDSLVFQCLCGHARGRRKSTTLTTTTSSTTCPTSKNTSTKTNKTSSSSKSSNKKKGKKSSTSTDNGRKKKEKKSSSSSTSTDNGRKKKKKSSTSNTSTKSDHKKGKKNSSSSTSTKSDNKKGKRSSTSSSSSTSTSSSSRNKKGDSKPCFTQVEIHCDRCRLRKTYLVCKECYSRHKITTCKDCKAPTVIEYIRYPSQNAFVNVAGQMVPQRPALPPPPPQVYQPQQQQQQPYEADDMVGAFADGNAALIVCCSSKTVLPVSNTAVYQDPGAAYRQVPVTTNLVLGIMCPDEFNEPNDNSTTSSSTTTTTSSSRTPVKSGTTSPTKSPGKSRTNTRSRNAGDENRGSSLCNCGHDIRTCRMCHEKKHTH